MDARSEGENIDGSGTQRAVLAGVVSPVYLGGSNINEFCSLLVLHRRKMQCSFRSISSGSHYWRRVCQRARKLHHSSVATYLTSSCCGKAGPDLFGAFSRAATQSSYVACYMGVILLGKF